MYGEVPNLRLKALFFASEVYGDLWIELAVRDDASNISSALRILLVSPMISVSQQIELLKGKALLNVLILCNKSRQGSVLELVIFEFLEAPLGCQELQDSTQAVFIVADDGR